MSLCSFGMTVKCPTDFGTVFFTGRNIGLSALSFLRTSVLFFLFLFLFTFISTCRLVLCCSCRFFSRQSLEPGLSCTWEVDSQSARSILRNSELKAIVISTIRTILTVVDFMPRPTQNALSNMDSCAIGQNTDNLAQVSSMFMATFHGERKESLPSPFGMYCGSWPLLAVC